MTDENQNENMQDTTQPEAEQTGTTPPQAENQGTTPPDSGNDGTTQPTDKPEVDVEKVVKKRLERERKKWEAERTQAEERARMDEAERLKAELADRDKAISEAQAQTKRERVLRTLSGKVVDPEDALAIAERAELIDEDGQVDVDALLQAKPYLAPQPAGPTPTTGAGGGVKRQLTREDLKTMTPKEINERWAEIQEALGKQ